MSAGILGRLAASVLRVEEWSAKLYGVISQNTVVLTHTTVRTWNLHLNYFLANGASVAVGFSVDYRIFYAIYLEHLFETLYPSLVRSFLQRDWFQHRCSSVWKKVVYWIPKKCIDIAGIYHIRTANGSVLYTAAVAILAHLELQKIIQSYRETATATVEIV
jgi:hypothetical protein